MQSGAFKNKTSKEKELDFYNAFITFYTHKKLVTLDPSVTLI